MLVVVLYTSSDGMTVQEEWAYCSQLVLSCIFMVIRRRLKSFIAHGWGSRSMRNTTGYGCSMLNIYG